MSESAAVEAERARVEAVVEAVRDRHVGSDANPARICNDVLIAVAAGGDHHLRRRLAAETARCLAVVDGFRTPDQPAYAARLLADVRDGIEKGVQFLF